MEIYHIVISKNKWCVKKEGAIKAIRVFKYRELAFGYILLRCSDFDLIAVHNKDATVLFQTFASTLKLHDIKTRMVSGLIPKYNPSISEETYLNHKKL
jgi:hypothetical protein